MTNYREILRLNSQGISQRNIAISCECSRNTVAKVLQTATLLEISVPLNDSVTNADLHKLLFPESTAPSSRKYPDYEKVHIELAKSHVNMSLVWEEYCTSCRLNNEIPLMYTQFCHHYRTFALKHKATMHIHRKPGEQIEVDWAGQKANLIDRDTGEIVDVSIFVGVLSCSQYAYVEAFLFQNIECWIAAHINMFRFFGGVTRILTPDNLKTGVDKISWYNPQINKTYQEMAEHYGTAVIPARVRKARDKPNVEGAVGIVSTWIIAAIRNQQLFSLPEMNETIYEKLQTFNEKPFQKKPGSRWSTFVEEEKDRLIKLPAHPYELATWKIATVQINYHISVEKQFYSIPYEFIKHKVDVRLTRNVIEVFFNNHRICSHVRLYGRSGQYSTTTSHMPEDHQKYLSWNSERFIAWATKIGPNTVIAVKSILESHKIEQQGYRSCLALLKLADKYSMSRLEAACCKALSYTPRPGFKNIQTILSTGQDKITPDNPPDKIPDKSTHGFTRGADYYGRKS